MRAPRPLRGLALAAAGALLTVTGASAAVAPGDLDASFGNHGSVYGAMEARALESADVRDAVVQGDGKFVLVGGAGKFLYGAASALLVARFDADGTPDPSFGEAGFVTTELGGEATANSVALQGDGKIVVAGSGPTGTTAGFLARYNADGSPDTSFGAGGTVTSLQGPGKAMAVQPNGMILVATQVPAQCSLTVARYRASGSPDSSFGTGGVATTDLGPNLCPSEDGLLLQPNGKVVVTGTAQGKLTVLRYTGSGSLDSSFGASGVATVNLGLSYLVTASPTGSLVQPDGKLVLATTGLDGFALVRLLPDGALDNSFGSGGIAEVAHPDCCVASRGIALQPNGKLLFAGGTLPLTPPNPGLLTRFNPEGSLDSSFGSGGTEPLDFGRGGVSVAAVSPDATGGIAILGNGTDCLQLDQDCSAYFGAVAVGRFAADGMPDTSFGDNGTVLASPPGSIVVAARNSHPKAVIAQPDRSVIVVGDSYAYDAHPYPGGSGFALAKYTSDGRLDASFGDDGLVATSLVSDPSALPTTATTALRQADGKIVVVGAGHARGTDRIRFALARYDTDGSLDSTFGDDGIVITGFPAQRGSVAGAVLEASGKIVVGGNVGQRATLVRYSSDGALDRSFGGDGIVALAGARSVKTLRAVALSGNGRILVAGTRGVAGPYSGAMVELNADGTRSLSFGGPRGVASVPVGKHGDVSALLMAADGRPLLLGRTSSRSIALFRYQADGKRDRLYNRRAAALRDVPGIGGSILAGTFQGHRGKLVLAGTNSDHFAMVRVRRNGTIDRYFGAQGVVISKVFGRLKAVTAAPGRILAAGDASFENPNGSNRQTFAALAAFHP